jgi:diacylglycerol kinase family enzyme
MFRIDDGQIQPVAHRETNVGKRGYSAMLETLRGSNPAKPLPVIINQQGGTASRAPAELKEELAALFGANGVTAKIHLVAGDQIASAVKDFLDCPIIVVGGGDGTLGAAACTIFHAKSDAALGILPLGTRNHFARDLGISFDLEAAVKTIAGAHCRQVDLARVGDHIFINNASIGLYPQMVRARDQLQSRFGIPKWMAMLAASGQALARLHSHRLDLIVDGKRNRIRSPLMFIGNNRYALEAGDLGTRARLDEAVLAVFAVGTHSRTGALAAALRMMVGRSDPERDFVESGHFERISVDGRRTMMTVALDGELLRLKTPLEFEILPKALTVIAPPDTSGLA